jgi:FkbM family methyltransferase
MHGHSVDIVSVFQFGQYTYAHGSAQVGVQPGDVVLDIGGCWGDTALHFAHLAGTAGKVFTFEFDPESLAILRANLDLNPELASRIEIVERAVWERSGDWLEFTQAGRCTVLTEEGTGDGIRAQSVTIDDFVREAGLERLDFVKVDVEGAEPSVLSGGQASFERFSPKLAVAAYHRDDDLVNIPRALAHPTRLYLDSYSPVEEETVLFAVPTARNNST